VFRIIPANPKVSIITPVYNVEEYIDKCIESVVSQSYRNWEWIIIDDGSTDSTSEILGKLSDNRITYLRQERLGPERIAKTFNRGLEKSRGEIIALLAGDDYWPENKLEVQITAFKDKEVVVSYGDVCIINKYGEKIFRRRPREKKEILDNYPIGNTLRSFVKLKNFIPAVTIMIRSKTLKGIGGFVEVEGLPAEDFPTLVKLALEGKFYYFPQVLGYYRKHQKSISFGESVGLLRNSSRYIITFVGENQNEIKKLNLPITVDDLKKIHGETLANTNKCYNFKVAMSHLINREYSIAEEFFIKQMVKSPISIYSFISLFGILVSRMKIIPKSLTC
jgi:glycosyltransferase involved in cell wall biosynthesis